MSSTPGNRWTTLTRVYLAVLLAGVVVLFVAGAILPAKPALENAAVAVLMACPGVSAILGLTWLQRAWARVPAPCRRAYDGRRIEPNEAIWKLFIPVYGIYWLFLANVGLCGAVERHLQRGGARSAKAPSTLAMICCLAQLVPQVNLVVSPFLWAVFMTRVDAAQAEAERLDPEASAAGAPGILKALGLVVGLLVLTWAALILLFLAIWQFLSPAAPHP